MHQEEKNSALQGGTWTGQRTHRQIHEHQVHGSSSTFDTYTVAGLFTDPPEKLHRLLPVLSQRCLAGEAVKHPQHHWVQGTGCVSTKGDTHQKQGAIGTRAGTRPKAEE